jgi:hypothetical protein
MKKQIVKYFLSAFVFVLLSGTTLFAQQQAADPKERQAPKKEFVREKLKLSKEQKEKIKNLRLESEKKSIDISAEIKKQKLELKELTGNKNITDDKVLEITRKISSLQADMKEIHVKQWLATYNLLDDKQKELFLRTSPILKEKMGEMRKNIRKRFERGDQKEN